MTSLCITPLVSRVELGHIFFFYDYPNVMSFVSHMVSSPELMRHPELNIDVKELSGPLLENNLITYLRNQ